MPNDYMTKLAAGLILGLLSAPTFADIFSYCEGEGEDRVCNFTNVPPNDRRYKLTIKSRATSPGAGRHQAGISSMTARPVDVSARLNPSAFNGIIAKAASAYSVDPSLVRAVIHAESAFNPNACSNKGACGLMQLMPDTARRYGVRDIKDPEQNIIGGTRYLRDLLAMFSHNKHMALAAYNAGENSVLRYGGIPPYRETVNYVTKVLFLHKRYQSQGIALTELPRNG